MEVRCREHDNPMKLHQTFDNITVYYCHTKDGYHEVEIIQS